MIFKGHVFNVIFGEYVLIFRVCGFEKAVVAYTKTVELQKEFVEEKANA